MFSSVQNANVSSLLSSQEVTLRVTRNEQEQVRDMPKKEEKRREKNVEDRRKIRNREYYRKHREEINEKKREKERNLRGSYSLWRRMPT